MRMIFWYLRAVVAGLTVGGLFVLLAHLAGAAEPVRRAGIWTVQTTDGHARGECGVATHLRDGTLLRLVIADGEVRSVAHHAGWMLPAGQAVRVAVDHDAFLGAADVADPSTLVVGDISTLVVGDLSDDFLRRFMTAPAMTAEIGGLRWKIDPHRSDDAAWALASCASAAGLADTT